MRKCSFVRAVDKSAIVREERNHLAVATVMRHSVEWFSDNKQRPAFSFALPTRPRMPAIAEASFMPKAIHQTAIEREGPIEVGDAYEDV